MGAPLCSFWFVQDDGVLFWVVETVCKTLTIGSQGVELTLKCTISDNESHEVYSTLATAKGSSYSAMYWGYGMTGGGNRSAQGGVHRSANMKALSNAVNLIIADLHANKEKILMDLQ